MLNHFLSQVRDQVSKNIEFVIGDSISKLVSEKFIEDSVYFYFETPNYKVQLGKYRSKIEAQKSLREVSKVFKSAFANKLNDFYAALGWGQIPENNNLGKFFSF